ncbi:CLUMA_CG020168, isoform A [Clunio marinus]|uniref:CLUMA_CG020168, isoform A n=1 Tax=Clunio marinus TaxID=568069 RepID=A0A1J1J452_9DIPT|nr:CLUMA_CG020168, isoform A [Clunio marinus]
MIEGIGVKHLMFTNDIAAGRCPFRAPTKKSLELAKIAPLSDPKVEQATKSGISQANIPIILSPNVTATASDA